MKKSIALFLAAVMLLVLTACGEGEPAQPEQETETVETVEPQTTEEAVTEKNTLFRQGLLPVLKDGKWGYVDEQGQFVIEPQFDKADAFSGVGLARVKVEEQFGYIDAQGEYVIEPQYDVAYSFAANGLAVVYEDDKWGYINERGQNAIEPQFDSALDFSDVGLASASMDFKYGLINEQGQWAVEPKFDYISEIFAPNGLAWAMVNRQYGFIDKQGQWIIEPQFAGAMNFAANGLAAVFDGINWGYIDAKGAWVIEPMYTYTSGFADNGLAMVSADDGKYGYINAQGQFAIEPRFGLADGFAHNGLAAVCVDGKWGYIDEQGQYIIPLKFDDAYSFFDDGFAIVKMDGRLGVIDAQGNYIFEPNYAGIQNTESYDFTEPEPEVPEESVTTGRYPEITEPLRTYEAFHVTNVVENADTFTLEGVIYTLYTFSDEEMSTFKNGDTLVLDGKTYTLTASDGTSSTVWELYGENESYPFYVIREKENYGIAAEIEQNYYLERQAQMTMTYKKTDRYRQITVTKDTVCANIQFEDMLSSASEEFAEYRGSEATDNTFPIPMYNFEFQNGKCVKINVNKGV